MMDLAQLCKDADHIIVGTGPASAAAAYRLVTAGLRVLMLDAGHDLSSQPPPVPAKASEIKDISPKLRDPRYTPLFARYGDLLQANTDNFSLWGMAAVGGLSNAWGGGIAEYNAAEFGSITHLPALQASYERLSARLSIYGNGTDRLSDFYGTHTQLRDYQNDNFALRKIMSGKHGFTTGSARYALGADLKNPYNAAEDIATLQGRENFTLLKGMALQAIVKNPLGYTLHLNRQPVEIPPGKLILACGTIMTTKLVLGALNATDKPVRLYSSPSAGFAVWFPGLSLRSMPPSPVIAAQASFIRQEPNGLFSMGNFFAPDLVDASELMGRMPLPAPIARQLLCFLLPGLVLGNAFMDGNYSDHRLALSSGGKLTIHGGYQAAYAPALKTLQKGFTQSLRRLRGITLPGSFKPTPPGSDIHYAATLPMRENPGALQAGYNGEVTGLRGITLVDGSILPSLPAKAHTFTIMANADRLATALIK